jgi:hypothetical protein
MGRISLIVLSTMLAGCSEYDLHTDKTNKNGPEDSGETDTDGDDTTVSEDDGGLAGRICTPNGNSWVANARVWVEVGGVVYETYSDADGYFTLTGVPTGIHTVYVEKGSFSTSFEVEVVKDVVTELATDECLDDDLSVAVVTGNYDTIENFLDDLGISYDKYDGLGTQYLDALLRDPAKLAGYDIVFINCSTMTTGMSYKTEIGFNLRNFVEGGGSIYASDYSYWFVELALPHANEFPGDDGDPGAAWGNGDSGYITGNVISPELQAALGKTTVELNYNTIWVPVDSTTGETLISDSYWGPLVTKYQDVGTALYTSFHNEAQSTADMDRLIEEFVFSL